jgi:hypothetical protein
LIGFVSVAGFVSSGAGGVCLEQEKRAQERTRRKPRVDLLTPAKGSPPGK